MEILICNKCKKDRDTWCGCNDIGVATGWSGYVDNKTWN